MPPAQRTNHAPAGARRDARCDRPRMVDPAPQLAASRRWHRHDHRLARHLHCRDTMRQRVTQQLAECKTSGSQAIELELMHTISKKALVHPETNQRLPWKTNPTARCAPFARCVLIRPHRLTARPTKCFRRIGTPAFALRSEMQRQRRRHQPRLFDLAERVAETIKGLGGACLQAAREPRPHATRRNELNLAASSFSTRSSG